MSAAKGDGQCEGLRPRRQCRRVPDRRDPPSSSAWLDFDGQRADAWMLRLEIAAIPLGSSEEPRSASSELECPSPSLSARRLEALEFTAPRPTYPQSQPADLADRD